MKTKIQAVVLFMLAIAGALLLAASVPSLFAQEIAVEVKSVPSIVGSETFVSLPGRFSIALPPASIRSFKPLSIETPEGRATGDAYTWTMKEGSFTVGYVDGATPFDERDKPFAGIREALIAWAESKNGKLIGERELDFNNHPALELKLQIPDALILQRFFLTSRRMYQLVLITGSTQRAYEALAVKTLDSFKVLSDAEFTAAQNTIAIRNVTVIPGNGAPPISDATVLIRDEHIAAIGPVTEIAVPAGARVIEGRDKFLVPGFIEMHAHLSKTRASALGLFIANGVTTVRDMGGDHEELLRWRQEIRTGKRVGPRMLIAGPYLESARNLERMRRDPPEKRIEPFEKTRIPVGSPAEARRIVAELSAKELDFLKIRTVQDQATYRALNEAANAHGIPLVGHVAGIPPEVVLEAGHDGVEHSFYPSLESKTREERLAVWRKFAERRVPIVPTLIALFEATFPPTERLRAIVEDEEGKIEPRRPYLSKYLVLDWREQVEEANDQRRQALRKIWEDVVRRDLREMHEAGMDVLVGSDVAVLNTFPGSSLHDEMALFVAELGMTPAEVLERATSRSARFLRIADLVGTVERGKIADLVLLDANPLQDIRNIKRIAAVMVRGRLYDAQGIKQLLEAVRTAPDRRVDDWGRKSSAAR